MSLSFDLHVHYQGQMTNLYSLKEQLCWLFFFWRNGGGDFFMDTESCKNWIVPPQTKSYTRSQTATNGVLTWPLKSHPRAGIDFKTQLNGTGFLATFSEEGSIMVLKNLLLSLTQLVLAEGNTAGKARSARLKAEVWVRVSGGSGSPLQITCHYTLHQYTQPSTHTHTSVHHGPAVVYPVLYFASSQVSVLYFGIINV